MQDSKITAVSVLKRIESLPRGEPFASGFLLACGSRGAVDQALARLIKAGVIERVARGLFVRPKMSRHVGAVMPDPQKVAATLAKSMNATVQVHGAEAALRLGLSTQVPLSPVFETSGPSRRVRMGALELQLRHVAPRKLVLAGRPAGLAIAAMWYLGKNSVSAEVVRQIERRLPAAEFAALKSAAGLMPAWMSAAIANHERPGTAPRQQRDRQKHERSKRESAAAGIPTTGLRDYIVGLARQHGVQYVKTPHDALADVITRLSDDEVKLDATELLLIALERAGVVPKENVVPLQVNYLREKLHV